MACWPIVACLSLSLPGSDMEVAWPGLNNKHDYCS